MPVLPPPRTRRVTALALAGLLAGGGAGVALAQGTKPPPLERPPGLFPGGPAPGVAAGKPPPLPPGMAVAPPGHRRGIASGTGFVVAPGRVMTNQHVVAGCAAVRLRTPAGREVMASIVAADPGRDLALLSVARGDAGALGPPLRFRSGPAVRRGEEVVTYGFPLAGLLSSGPTLTTGEVSALSGLRDNQAHFQISAPVQPGNSGGPLLDRSGHVVGVVTSKLNAQRVAQTTGDIPQNVNFAIKGEEAVAFLRRHGVRPLQGGSGAARGAAEVGEVAHPSTLFLRCER